MITKKNNTFAFNFYKVQKFCGFFFVPVKDVQLMSHSWPHMASSLQETPMKPSQISNKVPSSFPLRKLPLQHPHLYNRSRQSLLYQPSVCSPAPNSHGSFSPPINGLHITPRYRPAPFHQFVGSFRTNADVPLTSSRNSTTTHKSQTTVSFIFSSASPKIMKDLNSHSTPSHIHNNSTTKSKKTFSYSESKNVNKQKVFASLSVFICCLVSYVCFIQLW